MFVQKLAKIVKIPHKYKKEVNPDLVLKVLVEEQKSHQRFELITSTKVFFITTS